jgi:molybdopterin synthase sulfur carrier subunit
VDVLVRYYAGARAAARTDEEHVDVADGASVGDLVEVLSERHGAGLARVLASSSFIVDAVPGGRERSLDGAREVDVLPPFAGG